MGKRFSTLLLGLLSLLALTACGSSGSSSTSSGPSPPATSSPSAPQTSTATAAPSSSPAPQIGYEGVPLEQGPELAPASSTGTGQVDGISCAPAEQLVYHIHAHLAVFVNGRLYSLPAGIGIPGSVTVQSQQGPVAVGGRCYYWLHTHTADGIIHIESPAPRIYTLGNFFDEWHQPLTATTVGNAHGRITAFLNGKLWTSSPRAIPLLPRAVIQLQIGDPAPPLQSVNWSPTRL